MKYKIFIFFLIAATFLNAQDKRKLGIMPFKNESGSKYDWVSYGLDYLLENKLSVLSGFFVTEKQVFKKALSESGFYSKAVDEKMIYHIGKATGDEAIIYGKYKINGQNIDLEVIYYDGIKGTELFTSKYSDNLKNIFNISSKIVDQVINLAGVTVSAQERELLNRTITNSPKAFENFIKAYIENEKPNGKKEVITGLFRKAIREDANFLEAYYNLGIVYFNNGDYNKALQQFNKVIDILPNFAKAYYGRGLIYEKQRNYPDAQKDFQMVTKLNPNNYLGFVHLGKIDIRQRNYKAAQKNLEKAKSINPEYAAIYFELGNINYYQKQYRKSIAHYKNAIKYAPNNVRYHLRFGEAYYRSQVFYNANDEFNKVIELDPSNSVAYFMLGITIYKEAVIEELINAFLDLINSTEETAKVEEKGFNKKTGIDPVKKRGIYEDMAKNFKQAVELKPDFLEAVFNLALTYHEMGDFANAERYYRAAMLIKPSLLRTHLKLAQLYSETNRKEMAIDEYRKAFQYDPAFFYFKQTLGKEFQYVNIYNKFKAELDEKVKTNPNNPTTNITLAKLYKAQGYKGKASNLLRKVLAATPNNKEAKKLLAQMNKKS
jgi:tetratricopeptide (TPR) repeat protein